MTIKMVSTRDTVGSARSYSDVLLAGLAPDGGLYVPSEFPLFAPDELESLRSGTYEQIAFAVKARLVGSSISNDDLKEMIQAAYAADNFPREDGQVVPVRMIHDGLFVQNLSLGPTASFKDIAMQLLGREMEYELEKRREELVILGATSGDTGSAAEAAFKGLTSVMLYMLSPLEGMSAFQRAQMGALSGGNIRNISVRGRFDDCQDLVKLVKQFPEFASLGAVNSINWGRISSQVPYYFSGYFQVAKKIGDPVDFAVPSGNFGDVLSGYIAKKMGLPVRNLIVATNENDVLHRLFTTGVYEQTSAQITSSPSMDISKASNYERLVFDIFESDAKKVREYMDTFSKTGRVDFASFGLTTAIFSARGFISGRSTHADRLATIKKTYETSKTVVDPHTADGIFVGLQKKEDGVPMVCLATALPVKFEDTVRDALGFIPERPARFANIEADVPSDSFSVIDVNAEQLKQRIRAAN